MERLVTDMVGWFLEQFYQSDDTDTHSADWSF